MDKLLEKQIKELNKLKIKGSFTEIITQLPDQVIFSINDYRLFAIKAEALESTRNLTEARELLNSALELFPDHVLFYLILARIESAQKNHSKAFDLYQNVLDIDKENVSAHLGMAGLYIEEQKYPNAFQAYQKAIELNSRFYYSYYCRAFLYLQIEELNKALTDASTTIRHASSFREGYLLRAEIWIKKKEPQRALKDLDKAINVDGKFKQAYYVRAMINNALGKPEDALADYERYIALTPDPEDYQRKNSQIELERLNKKLANKWYDEIDNLIQRIKNILLFEKDCLSHYTSMTAAQEMILNDSLFRISEGAFLNDTSEGRELFAYLSFSINRPTIDDTISEMFVERPFIGSFVADSKHNDLALWRMYGKEKDAEAKGCSLTIKRNEFLASVHEQFNKTAYKSSMGAQQEVTRFLKDKIEGGRGQSTIFIIDDEINKLLIKEERNSVKFQFFNVAYYQKGAFFIPGSDEKTGEKLNKLLTELKKLIAPLNDDQRIAIAEILNDIAYLFKSAEYQYENEVRLVVQDIGMPKKIAQTYIPPRVHIELLNIRSVLHRITLGPKVERADEWAAAFNYHIKEHSVNKKTRIEIIISHLPFK